MILFGEPPYYLVTYMYMQIRIFKMYKMQVLAVIFNLHCTRVRH